MKDTVRLLFALLVALSVATGAADASRLPCPPPQAEVIKANRQAVIFEGGLESLGEEENFGWHGCVRGFHRFPELGFGPPQFTAAGGAGISHVTLSGVIVGMEEVKLGAEISVHRIKVIDLRTGRVVHEVPDGARVTPEEAFIGVGPVAALVLKTDGSVAWIVRDLPRSLPPAGTPIYDLYVLDRRGQRMITSSTSLSPHSLRLKRGRIDWVQSGRRHSAPIL